VDFAQTLTARPWAIGPADIRRLSEAGLSRTSIVLAIGLVALFNYLTRVADGTGVEADYRNGLPEFVYRGVTESVPRPGPEEWPPVDHSIEPLAVLPDVHARWGRWRDYLLESPEPISVTTRRQLRAIAARNACDGAIAPPDDADSNDGAWSGTGSGDALSQFADKLSLTPWLMTATDVDGLRSIGMDDRSILHVIAVVAYQSAESRLRMGLSALSRSEDLPFVERDTPENAL
jgi:alkylhydroperoxidase family enzyme